MRLSIVSACIIVGTCTLYSAESDLISSLNEDMVQAAQSASDSNQNIDYQPFILSVWHHDDLVRFGVRTLKDALLLVPGIQLTGDTMNNRTAIVRGSNPFAYGQTKLVIDGMVVNDQTFDSYSAYLDFPIDIISRIEVVRGSGNFVQGVNGYSGTINIITKPHGTKPESKDGAMFASVGNNDFRQAGGWTSYDLSSGTLSVDAFYQADDSLSPIKATDAYGYTGYAPLQTRYIGAGISYRHDSFYLLGRFNDYEHGSAFGNLNALPTIDSRQTNSSWNLEVGNRFDFGSDLQFNVKAGIMEDVWESDAFALPIDFYAYLKLKNRRTFANASAIYTGIENHTLSVGYTLKHEKLIDSARISTDMFGGTDDIIDYTDTYPLLDREKAERHIHNLYIGDSIDINNETALDLNAEAEMATHMPFHIHARGALVYQPNRTNIFKAIVSHSCRLPSWQEMYTINNPVRIGNPDLKPEHVLSYELQYLYKPYMNATFGLNLFYLENDKQITAATPDHVFRNLAERNIFGFESEYRGSIGENGLIALSYTHIDGENIKLDEETDFLPYSSSDLLKGAFSYRITPELNAGITARYESAKKRSPFDPRGGEIKPFSSIDLNLGWENAEGFYVQGLIKNIADHIYRYPAPAHTYTDDYPVEGRTFYVRTGWKF